MLTNYKNYIKNGDLSATNFTGSTYQLKLAIEKTEKMDTPTGVASLLGTGLHLIAEEYYKSMPNVLVENRATRMLNRLIISGTADLVAFDTVEEDWTIIDHKTKGAYSAKKFLSGDNEAERLQLSINRWIRIPQLTRINKTGQIHLYITGDIPHASKTTLGAKEQVVEIDLYGEDTIERLMNEKIEAAKSMTKPDCQEWQCDYCDYICKFRKQKDEPKEKVEKVF